jgi:hypothetical protein
MDNHCILASALQTLQHLGWTILHHHADDGHDSLSRPDVVAIAAATGELLGAWRIETECDENGSIYGIALHPRDEMELPAFEITRSHDLVEVRIMRRTHQIAPKSLAFGIFQSLETAMHAIHNEVAATVERSDAQLTLA